MQYRNLANTNEKLSAIGLGCMGMSFAYGPRDDEHSTKVLHEALELGINFWDTADMYGQGHNEELVGKVIRSNREKVFIATKFGFRYNKDFNPKDMKTYKTYFDGHPEYAKEACEASLKRLGIDTIDMYYSHRVDPNIPIEETVGAMGELVREGKVRYLGLSEASSNSLQKANKEHPISALQSEYSLFTRDIEGEILQTCRDLNISIVPYSPLGRGLLTGNITEAPESKDDFRVNLPRFQKESLEQNLKLVNELKRIAHDKDCTPSQLAIAWLLHQGNDILPIPGTKKIKYLRENAEAVDIKLTVEELEKITDLSDNITIAGERYSEGAMKLINN